MEWDRHGEMETPRCTDVGPCVTRLEFVFAGIPQTAGWSNLIAVSILRTLVVKTLMGIWVREMPFHPWTCCFALVSSTMQPSIGTKLAYAYVGDNSIVHTTPKPKGRVKLLTLVVRIDISLLLKKSLLFFHRCDCILVAWFLNKGLNLI